MAKKTIFLDLYGTIIKEDKFGAFLNRIGLAQLKPKMLENSLTGLELIKDEQLILVSNQAPISYGLMKEKDFKSLLERVYSKLMEKHIKLAGMYYCPHRPKDRCKCRKPEIGMLEQAISELNLDLSNSWFIGDQTCDIKTGERIGVKTILLETGHAGKDKKFNAIPDYVAKDLYGAAIIINNN